MSARRVYTIRNTVSRVQLMRTLLGAALALGATACAHSSEEGEGAPVYVQAQPEAPKPAEPEVVAIPYAQPLPGHLAPWSDAAPSTKELSERSEEALSLSEAVARANELANQAQRGRTNIRARHVYPYLDGGIYPVLVRPKFDTLLTFAPGERVWEDVLGDDQMFTVDLVRSGGGDGALDPPVTEHLLVSARQLGAHTSLKVLTSRGVYNFALHSHKGQPMAQVSFTYPERDALAKRQRALHRMRDSGVLDSPAAAADAAAGAPEASSPQIATRVEDLECGYELVFSTRRQKRRPPVWAPVRVCHDGEKTYVWFSEEAERRGARPTLFVLDAQGDPELPQFIQRPRLYAVVGVVERAQLVVGDPKGSGSVLGIELKKGASR